MAFIGFSVFSMHRRECLCESCFCNPAALSVSPQSQENAHSAGGSSLQTSSLIFFGDGGREDYKWKLWGAWQPVKTGLQASKMQSCVCRWGGGEMFYNSQKWFLCCKAEFLNLSGFADWQGRKGRGDFFHLSGGHKCSTCTMLSATSAVQFQMNPYCKVSFLSMFLLQMIVKWLVISRELPVDNKHRGDPKSLTVLC